MGFKDLEYASLRDLLKASERKKISLIPKQRDILIGEAGKFKKGKSEKGWEIPEVKSTEIEIKKVIKEGKPQELKVLKEMYTILEREPVRIRYVKDVEKTKSQRLIEERLERESRKSKTKKDEADLNNFLKDQEKTKGARGRGQEELILRTPQRPVFRPTKRITPRDVLRDIPQDIPRDVFRDFPREIQRGLPRTPTRDIPRITERDIPRDVLRDFPRRTPRRPTPRIPTRTPKKPPVIKFGKKIIQPVKETKAPSYDVMIKSQEKFRKITKNPIGLKDARNLRDFGIDNSLSRQGYLKPRQVKPSPSQYDINPSYSKDNAFKLRTFKQKKGQKFKLPKERKIEYSKYALDKKSEVKQINVFKLLAQREKKKRKLNRPSWESFA